jgi:YHS domain-containing protein
MQDIICPRMRKLVGAPPRPHVSDVDESVGYGVFCELARAPDYPTDSKLGIGVSADRAMENAIIFYRHQIPPTYFKFLGHRQRDVHLNAVDERAISAWVDRKLIDFTDTYLQLQSIDQYQQEHWVIDPVCGMRINRAIAPSTSKHKERTYYFCAEACQRKFVEDPDRYAAESLR